MEAHPAYYGLGVVPEDYRGTVEAQVNEEDFQVDLDYEATSLYIRFHQGQQNVKRIELQPEAATHRVADRRYLEIYYRTTGNYLALDQDDWQFDVDPTGKVIITFSDPLIAAEIKIHCKYDDRDEDYLPVKVHVDKSDFSNLARAMVKVYCRVAERNESYIYDGNGNRTQETITTVVPRVSDYTYYPGSDRLKYRISMDGTVKWAFTYDNNGNLIKKGNTFTEPGGEIVYTESGEGVIYWKYDYDVLGRLITVWEKNVLKASYIYDPTGLRIFKNGTKDVLYDYDLAGNVIGEQTGSEIKSYVWVTGRHLARVDGVIGGNGNKYFYETDHLGSPMVVTNQSGQVVWRGDFTPFGERIRGDGDPEGYEDTHGFTGKDWDEEAGLYYFNARWYDSELGQFISQDPIGDPSNPNSYSYVGNNPMRYIDPLGLWRYEIDPETGDIYAIAEEKDTLLGLCSEYYGNSSLYGLLAEDNGIEDPGTIEAGQRIKLGDYNKVGRQRHGQLLKIGYLYGDVSIDAINNQGFYIWGMINRGELNYLKGYYQTLEKLYEAGAITKEQFEKEAKRLDHYSSGGALWEHVHGGNVEYREDPFYVAMGGFMAFRLLQVFGPSILASPLGQKILDQLTNDTAKTPQTTVLGKWFDIQNL